MYSSSSCQRQGGGGDRVPFRAPGQARDSARRTVSAGYRDNAQRKRGVHVGASLQGWFEFAGARQHCPPAHDVRGRWYRHRGGQERKELWCGTQQGRAGPERAKQTELRWEVLPQRTFAPPRAQHPPRFRPARRQAAPCPAGTLQSTGCSKGKIRGRGRGGMSNGRPGKPCPARARQSTRGRQRGRRLRRVCAQPAQRPMADRTEAGAEPVALSAARTHTHPHDHSPPVAIGVQPRKQGAHRVGLLSWRRLRRRRRARRRLGASQLLHARQR